MESLEYNTLGKLKIDCLLDLPVMPFPINETLQVRYVVGHYVGTSFRVLYRCSSFDDANKLASSYFQASGRKCEIFKSIINIQKLKL